MMMLILRDAMHCNDFAYIGIDFDTLNLDTSLGATTASLSITATTRTASTVKYAAYRLLATI